jgi:hypothetical protein
MGRQDGKTARRQELETIESGVEAEIEAAEAEALASKEHAIPAGESALGGVYAN